MNFRDRIIELNPPGRRQTSKRRLPVPITDALYPWLKAGSSEHLVSWRGKPIKDIRTALDEACGRAGIRRIIPYTIRHTMAKELRRRGVPEWEVAGMLGHKIPGYDITEVYAKYRPDYFDQARQAIDAYFAELQKPTPRPVVLANPATPEMGQ